jgi:2-C-methyl-D-erythritol 4-phosphate cytidylyltransferase/2-C-methyl-D-erythritol 2,4-cyclodiphosphate synthase
LTPVNIHLIQLAGGKGLRAGGADVPKQFRPTGRGLLFTVSLAEFLKLPAAAGRIASLTVTVPESWRDSATAALENLKDRTGRADLPVHLADAGETRTRSTWSALSVLAGLDPDPDDLVAIHDAARPFATADLLARLVAAAAETGGAIPGVPVADTIVQVEEAGDPDGSAGAARAVYLDRSRLLGVQTPQVFRWVLLHAAHQWAARQGAEFTDDGSLLAARGHDPALVAGEAANWKVTSDGDWKRAEGLLR